MDGKSDGVLVFPCGMSAAQDFARQASRAGFRVVGASSLRHEPSRALYGEWVRLPYASDPAFAHTLLEVCAQRGVTRIFTPHIVVWRLLADLLAARRDIRLWNENPAQDMGRPLRRSAALVERHAGGGGDLRLPGARPARARDELAALLLHADRIDGMCDDAKILMLAEAMRSAPAGDVVEIGVWCGKSSLALLLLARMFGVGPVLCIDPWSRECLGQFAGGHMVDQATAGFDCDEMFDVFCANLRPYAAGDLNYLRLPAAMAAERYGAARVTSSEFGTVDYSGRIVLLHIDGNHGLAAVRCDCATWIPFVAPGGWVVIDDYRWAFADGPQRAADEWLARQWGDLECCFVAGETLFAKLRSASAR